MCCCRNEQTYCETIVYDGNRTGCEVAQANGKVFVFLLALCLPGATMYVNDEGFRG